MANYSHKPIDLDRTAIRQLLLRKGYDTDPIRCELFQSFLGDDHVPYEAVSYTWRYHDTRGTRDICGDFDTWGDFGAWRDRGDKNQIELDEQPFLVGKNLYTALRHIRSRYTDRILWVDAICIDQANEGERNHQVKQMDTVYSTAENVLVWLGPGSRETDAVMELAKALDSEVRRPAKASLDDWRTAWVNLCCNTDGTANALRADRVLALTSLFEHPWFTRAWVVQEVALAERVTVVCGSKSAPARAFALMPALLGVKVEPDIQALLDVMPGPFRHDLWSKHRPDLFRMLQKFGRRAATDPRDRIYALFGIASDMSTKPIRPRYEEDISVAVADVMRFFMFGNASGVSNLEFPKWTVDQLLEALEDDNFNTLARRLLEWSLSEEIHDLTEKLLGRKELDLNSPRLGLVKQPVLHYLASNPNPKHLMFLEMIVDRQDLDVDLNLLGPGKTPLTGEFRGLHQTPLAVALECGNIQAAKLLLGRSGVDLAAEDACGKTPLALAARRDQTQLLELILSRHPHLASTDTSALSAALQGQAQAAAQFLIARGAMVQENDLHSTLIAAFNTNSSKFVSLILDHIPGGINTIVNVGLLDSDTPLCLATERGKLNIVHLLIDKGANLELKRRDGRSPLSVAALMGHLEIVKVLIDYGANTETRTSWHETPLWEASRRGNDAIVNALIKSGVNIEARDSYFHATPLWIAAYQGRAKTVELLLEAGASLSVEGLRFGDKLTPREVASARDHKGVLEILPREI